MELMFSKASHTKFKLKKMTKLLKYELPIILSI